MGLKISVVMPGEDPVELFHDLRNYNGLVDMILLLAAEWGQVQIEEAYD
jgi:hypothetical protein